MQECTLLKDSYRVFFANAVVLSLYLDERKFLSILNGIRSGSSEFRDQSRHTKNPVCMYLKQVGITYHICKHGTTKVFILYAGVSLFSKKKLPCGHGNEYLTCKKWKRLSEWLTRIWSRSLVCSECAQNHRSSFLRKENLFRPLHGVLSHCSCNEQKKRLGTSRGV